MEGKDNIENLILKNLKGLNDNEPPAGHFIRFQEKLKEHHKKKGIKAGIVLKVAAAVIFVFLAVNQAIIYFSPGNDGILATKENDFLLSPMTPNYEEVEYYYTNSINTGLNQWKQLKRAGLVSKEEQQIMNSELKEFKKMHQSLMEDLAINPGDERIINAILEYYQIKLKVITMIIDKIQETQQLNEEKAEAIKHL